MINTVRDAQGYPITAAGPDTARGLDRAVAAYLGARTDVRERVTTVLADDPTSPIGQALDGYLLMLASNRDSTTRARQVATEAKAAAERYGATPREALHLDALDAWARGDMRAAAGRWEALLAEHPRDVLAVRVSQFVLSYLGESERMRETIARILPAWSADVPGYAFVLGCHAYALEETGHYEAAEEAGLRAVAINPEDIWAAHAVTHVREMEGRLREGVAWIAAYGAHWTSCNNFATHLKWHEGLFELELERYDRVLELFDRDVRVEASDQYLDIVNGASLLWRLEQAGVDVGARWRDLAAGAKAHAGDHALVFADVHYLLVLAAVGDPAVDDLLAAYERFAREGSGTEAVVMAEVGEPLARAVVAHRRGAYRESVDLLSPVRERVRMIGGSHAQRDVFEQLLIDSAWRSGRLDLADSLLGERLARRPRNRWGWKHRAIVLESLGRSDAASARGELDRLRSV